MLRTFLLFNVYEIYNFHVELILGKIEARRNDFLKLYLYLLLENDAESFYKISS